MWINIGTSSVQSVSHTLNMLISSATDPSVTGTPMAPASLGSADTNCTTRKMTPEGQSTTGTATMECRSTTTGINKPTTDLCAPLHAHVINLLSSNLSLQSTTATMSQDNVVEKTTAVAPAMPTATKKSAKMQPEVMTTARSIKLQLKFTA